MPTSFSRSTTALVTTMIALTLSASSAQAQDIVIDKGELRLSPLQLAEGLINNGEIILEVLAPVSFPAVRSVFHDVEITNNGLIKVGTGQRRLLDDGITLSASGGALGIIAQGERATITNSGRIEVTSSDVFSPGNSPEYGGISATNTDVEITNSGTITATGANQVGIVSHFRLQTTPPSQGTRHINAKITNSGTITAIGDNVRGIRSTGANAEITSSGTITAIGANAIGIEATGNNAVITINGLVEARESANGALATAIQGSDEGNQKLILLEGAEIKGKIRLGTGAGDLLVDSDGNVGDFIDASKYRGMSLTLVFESAEAETIIPPTFIIDHTGSSATRMALAATMGQIHRQASHRLAFAPQPSADGAETGGAGWGTVLGSHLKRGSDGDAIAWKRNLYGLVGGYDTLMESGQRVGLFAGFGREEISTSKVSITDTANRLFAGVYGQQVFGDLTVNGSLVFGRADHKATRTVGDTSVGRETAKGKYNSTSISPSLNLTWSRALPNGFELRPSAQIAYTYGSFGGYTETGTTNSNVTFGKRKVNIVDSRLQLALAQPFAADQGEIEWRAGITSTHYGNSSGTTRVGGNDPESYAVPGDRSLFGGFVGATLHYAIADRVSLDSSVEYARTSGDATGSLSGQLGLLFKF